MGQPLSLCGSRTRFFPSTFFSVSGGSSDDTSVVAALDDAGGHSGYVFAPLELAVKGVGHWMPMLFSAQSEITDSSTNPSCPSSSSSSSSSSLSLSVPASPPSCDSDDEESRGSRSRALQQQRLRVALTRQLHRGSDSSLVLQNSAAASLAAAYASTDEESPLSSAQTSTQASPPPVARSNQHLSARALPTLHRSCSISASMEALHTDIVHTSTLSRRNLMGRNLTAHSRSSVNVAQLPSANTATSSGSFSASASSSALFSATSLSSAALSSTSSTSSSSFTSSSSSLSLTSCSPLPLSNSEQDHCPTVTHNAVIRIVSSPECSPQELPAPRVYRSHRKPPPCDTQLPIRPAVHPHTQHKHTHQRPGSAASAASLSIARRCFQIDDSPVSGPSRSIFSSRRSSTSEHDSPLSLSSPSHSHSVSFGTSSACSPSGFFLSSDADEQPLSPGSHPHTALSLLRQSRSPRSC